MVLLTLLFALSSWAGCTTTHKTFNGCAAILPCPSGTWNGGTCEYLGFCASQYDGISSSAPLGEECDGSNTGGGEEGVKVSVTCCTPDQQSAQASATATATATGTATSTGTSTGTGTNPPVASGPSGSSPAATDSTPAPAPAGQKQSFAEVSALYDGMASQQAAIGGLHCLLGAAQPTGSDHSTAFAARCNDDLARADALRASAEENAKRGNVPLGAPSLDQSILDSEFGQKVLESYKKSSGVSGEDLLHRFLAKGERRDALEATGAGAKEGSDVSVAAKGPHSEMREKLRKAMVDSGQQATPTSVKTAAPKVKVEEALLDSLTPDSTALGDLTSELTIFDVVRARYRQKWPLLLLERQKH
jgi:hypothetical protein